MKKLATGLLSLSLTLGLTTAVFADSTPQEDTQVQITSEQENVISPMAVYYDQEPNHSIYTASPFGVPGSVSGKTNYTDDKEDFYKITPSQSGTLIVRLSPIDKDTDFGINLYNSYGNKLKNIDDGNEGAEEVLLYDVQEGQTYYVEVSHLFKRGGGRYLLTSSLN